MLTSVQIDGINSGNRPANQFPAGVYQAIICINCIILCMQELLQQQQRGEREVTSLSHRVDRLQLKNEALLRKIDKLKHEHQNSPREGKVFLNMVDFAICTKMM